MSNRVSYKEMQKNASLLDITVTEAEPEAEPLTGEKIDKKNR